MNKIQYGTSGNDTLDGGKGNDTLVGGEGNDVYIIDSAKDVLDEQGDDTGVDTVIASISINLSQPMFAKIENVTLSGKANLNATGNAADNVLIGNAGNNSLDGGEGADHMAGGLGNDTYYVDNLGDTVTEDPNSGKDTVISAINLILAQNVENLTLTGNADLAIGNGLDNVLTGNNQDNTLDGGLGKDTMKGGAGNDTYQVDNIKDSITEQANQGIDTVEASITYTLGKNMENLTLLGNSDISGTGNELDNILTGNDGDNILDGKKGADRMSGGSGNDTYVVDNAADTVLEDENAGIDTVLSNITYTLGTGVENLTLTGKANINATGNDLANVLIGNTGINTLTGDEGNDTYVVQNLKDAVVETAMANYDSVLSAVSYTLGADLEDLILTGKSSTSATGNELSNFLQGNTGNNTLDGGEGADRMAGGLGNDVYYVDNHADVIIEQSNAGIDTVMTTVEFDLPDNVENLTLLGDTRIMGIGNNLNNKIVGNSATNYIDGRSGADTMQGMGGNDFYFVDNSQDQVIEAKNQGVDWVQSSISYTLPANVEVLMLTSDNTVGRGNSASNELLTYGENTTLDGGGGNDTLWSLNNNNNNNLLKGGEGDDLLLDTGNGNTTLDGGKGYDLMIGGSGDNTYLNVNDGDAINDIGGYDTISIPNYRFIDNNVDFYAADYLSGPASADLNFQPDGRLDTLVMVLDNQEIALLNFFANNSSSLASSSFGRGEIEQFNFKDGSFTANDILQYLIDNNIESDFPPATDQPLQFIMPIEQPMFGELSSQQGVGSNAGETLTGTLDNDYLQGLDGNDSLSGREGDDGLYGGNQNDTLNGGSGNDFLSGGEGSDTYKFNDGWDSDVLEDTYQNATNQHEDNTLDFSAVTTNLTINGNSGATDGSNTVVWQDQPFSRIIGGAGNDRIMGGPLTTLLLGGMGADSLAGGESNDSLDGGAGNDFLLGGYGNDNYRFSAGQDMIYDSGALDQLDLPDFRWDSGNITVQAADLMDESGPGQTDGLYDSLILSSSNRQVALLGYFDNTSATVSDSGQGSGLIESLTFADTTLDFADVQAVLAAMAPANSQNSQQEPIASYLMQAAELNGGYTFKADSIPHPPGASGLPTNSGASQQQGISLITQIPVDDGQQVAMPKTADPSTLMNTFNQSATTFEGSDNNDTMTHTNSSAHIFWGHGGNDKLNGGKSYDEYVFDGEWGHDTITDSGGSDMLELFQVSDDLLINLSLDNGTPQVIGGDNSISWTGKIIENVSGGAGNDLIIGNNAGNYLSGGYSVANDTLYGLGGNDHLEGLHGDDILYGGTGSDTIDGGAGNDIIYGGAGDDMLNGSEGNDSYVFSKADGNDYISDWTSNSDHLNYDTVYFDSSVHQSEVAFYLYQTSTPWNSSGSLQIGYTDTSDSSIGTQWFGTEMTVERFELSNGLFLTSDDLNRIMQDMTSVAHQDSIPLTGLDDVKSHHELMAVINAAWHH